MAKSNMSIFERYPVYRLTQEAYDQLRLMADEFPESYLDADHDLKLHSASAV